MELQVIDKRNILDHEVTTYGDLENPLFIAKDVADWIGYDASSVNKMINNVDEDEKLNGIIFRAGQNREMTFLTEDGLYEVLMQSRKPIAKQFKKEVKKILKQIRQTGGYIPHNEEMSDEEIMARALQVANKTIEKKNKELKLAEEENLKLAGIIENQKPRLDYLDEILSCDDALLVTSIAFDYGLSAQALNKILCEERVQRKVRNQYILYSDYLGKGYTKTETKMIGEKPRVQTLWTQKGRMLIHEILNKREIRALMDLELAEA